MLFSLNKKEWLGNSKYDVLAGLVSSVAILPEVIGFAIIAGVNPITALFASAILLLIITFTGGRPAMVSAAAGSMALVMADLIKSHGLNYMIAATILTGFIQLILGYLGIQKVMKFISKTVMYGFVNALAILIFLAQIQQLPGQNYWTYLMVLITILLMYSLPKITKAVPPALIIIVLMTISSMLFPELFQKVGDMGDMTKMTPALALPSGPFNLTTLRIIFPTSLALAMVGLIESLLTIPIVDKMTNSQGDAAREVKAQGLANIVTGFFGGQAGCAMIGQAVVNVKSGGRKRLSTLVSSVTLLLLIFSLKGLMVQIPTAALIGIMITVAFATFEWDSLELLRAFEVTESLIMLVTIGVVIYTHNLAIGILIGVLLSVVIFVAKLSKITMVEEKGWYRVKGLLFFASMTSFTHLFQEQKNLPSTLHVDFSQLYVLDHTAITELKSWIAEKASQSQALVIRGLADHNLQLSQEIDQILKENSQVVQPQSDHEEED